MTRTERLLRALLRTYPSHYGQVHGDEIVGTLLDALDARPIAALPETVAMLAHACRLRLGLRTERMPGRVLMSAAGPALCCGTALAGVLLFGCEWLTGAGAVHGREVGPFRTTGPGLYVLWILAPVAALVAGRRAFRGTVGATLVAVLASVVLQGVGGPDRPPLYVLVAFCLFALIVLIAPAGGPTIRPAHVLGAAAVAGVLVAGDSIADHQWHQGVWAGYWQNSATPWAVVILAVAGAAVVTPWRPLAGAAVLPNVLVWAVYGYGADTYRHPAQAAAVAAVAIVAGAA